jgi:hypothetical protein
MILAGYHHGANILDLITITCFIQAGHSLGIKKNKYVPRNPLDLPAGESALYYKLLFMDEFIEYLFIWNDYLSFVDEIMSHPPKKDTVLKELQKWADDNKFNPDVLLSITAARDELITDLLNVGMNPFYNGLGLPRGKYDLVRILNKNLVEGMEEIAKIKKCILEGYRLNLYMWNAASKSYISVINHNPVTLDSKLLKSLNPSDPEIEQVKPQKIIVSGVTLRPSFTQKGMYEFIGADVSVLDGFIDPDLDFLDF